MTDKDNNIVKIFLNEASEKRFKGPKKTYFTYVFKGNTLNNYTCAAAGVAPVLSLTSKLDIGSGSGTSSSPYQLSV